MANLRTNNLSGEGGRNAYNGSVFFDGTENRLDVAHSTDFDIADSNTFECWIYYHSLSANNLFLGIESSYWIGYNHVEIGGSSNKFVFTIYNGSSWQAVSSSTTPAVKTWHHIAAVKDGTSLKMYINGVLENTTTMSGTAANNSDLFNIGKWNQGGTGVNGYLSNVRVCKGHAVYTANFTPPTSPLTVHYNSDGDETVLLCCQDSDNPLQEATGKTLIASGGLVEGDDTELITNSGFTADISGWTASGVQWSHSSGALMHFGNGNTQRNIYQDVTTVVGRKYVFRVEASSAEASTAYWQVIGSSDLAGNNYIADNNNAAPLEYRFYFTADQATTRIRFYSYDSSNSSNVRSYWYKASLKLAPQGEVPKVLPPFGTDAGNTFGGAISMNSPSWMYFPTGRTEERARGRAIFMGGSQTPNTPKVMDTIDYVEMTTSGVGVRFGSLTTTCAQSAAFASSTRGINAGGTTSAPGDNQTNIIEFVTIATEGNGTDFGDLDTTHRRLGGSGHSSQTRGIITGGSGDSPGETNVIQFVTIASIGNATDFGDLLNPKDNMQSKNGSSTRMLICGGRDYTPSATVTNVIEFLTIATTGNSADFGDLTQARYAGTGCGSATRGVIAGGQTPTYVNTIDFVTIASAGDATDFGDLTATNSFLGGASNSIKGIFAGGATPTKLSTIQSIEIATTGDAVAFGDNTATNPVTSRGTCSDSHGGLS